MDIPASPVDQAQIAARFLTSLGIGLVMGLERERKVGANAGLRTFTLAALLGTLCGLLAQGRGGDWLLAAGLLGLALVMIAADRRTEGAAHAPDATTTVALLLCFSLGAAVWLGYSSLSVGIALAATALLHFKAELHGVSHRLTRHDIVSILQFAAITFVVLPVLPDAGYGPHGVLNPYRIWLVVVLTSAVSLAGYAALRIAPSTKAVPLLGVLGGSVSSTATTLVFARLIRRDARELEAGLGVILIANLVVLLRITVITATLAPSLLWQLVPVLAAGFAAGALGLARRWIRLSRQTAPLPEFRNPTSLLHALGFAAGFAVILVAGAWIEDSAGIRGVYGLAAVSGLFDIDAVTVSTLDMNLRGSIDGTVAVRALVLAYGANLLMKLALLRLVGGGAPLPHAALHGAATLAGLGAGLVLLA